MSVIFSADEAAELADIKPTQLKLWLQTGQFKTDTWSQSVPEFLSERTYAFTQADISRLVEFAASHGKRKATKSESFVDDHKQEFFTVKQLAQLWNLSEDVIRKEFENESGVLKLARKRKGKRPYKTLRIPRGVADRVRTRMSS